jgi:hypothetical protein
MKVDITVSRVICEEDLVRRWVRQGVVEGFIYVREALSAKQLSSSLRFRARRGVRT